MHTEASFCIPAQNAEVNNCAMLDVPALQMVVEMPKYPGGDVALIKYISENMKYPQEALDKNISGRVIVNFVVTKTGNIADIKIKRSSSPLLDDEAIRIVKSFPKFTPGKIKGEPVNTLYTLPIKFSLPRK